MHNFIKGLDLQDVENVEEAEFVQTYKRILDLYAAKGIPMVVANPDYITVEARGYFPERRECK